MTDELVAIHHVVMDMGRQCGCSCCTEPAERQAGAHRLDQNSGHALPYADTACCSTAVAGTSNNWKHSSTAPQRGSRGAKIRTGTSPSPNEARTTASRWITLVGGSSSGGAETAVRPATRS